MSCYQSAFFSPRFLVVLRSALLLIKSARCAASSLRLWQWAPLEMQRREEKALWLKNERCSRNQNFLHFSKVAPSILMNPHPLPHLCHPHPTAFWSPNKVEALFMRLLLFFFCQRSRFVCSLYVLSFPTSAASHHTAPSAPLLQAERSGWTLQKASNTVQSVFYCTEKSPAVVRWRGRGQTCTPSTWDCNWGGSRGHLSETDEKSFLIPTPPRPPFREKKLLVWVTNVK